MTLSVSESTYVLSWTVPGRGEGNVGGTISIQAGRLELLAAGTAASESMVFHLVEGTLALDGEDSSWDFGDGAEEPAGFVAVLVRL